MGLGPGERGSLLLPGPPGERHLLCVPIFLARSVCLSTFAVRMDLGKLYERGDFILLPTLKTYADALTFAKRAGYRNRDEEDESPRRPLTAVRNTLATVWPLF